MARNRAQMRAAKAIERQTRLSGDWLPWTITHFVAGVPHARGWLSEIRAAWSNTAYVALVRPVVTAFGEVIHLAIRTPAGQEPPWRDLQRIKNEIVGPERYAVQVCPPESRLIDGADMYHLWVMPEGFAPGFGLHGLDEEQA